MISYFSFILNCISVKLLTWKILLYLVMLSLGLQVFISEWRPFLLSWVIPKVLDSTRNPKTSPVLFSIWISIRTLKINVIYFNNQNSNGLWLKANESWTWIFIRIKVHGYFKIFVGLANAAAFAFIKAPNQSVFARIVNTFSTTSMFLITATNIILTGIFSS